jgi:hypothetical protein
MNVRFSKRAAVTVGMAAAIIGGTASAYAVGSGVTASATDVVITSSGPHNLSANGGVRTTVLTATLPSGKWVLSASGNLVDWGPSDYTRCAILVGGTQVAGVSTMVGDPNGVGNWGPSSILSPFSLIGAVALKTSGTATIQCWHDSTVSSSGYVDPGATLQLHKTTSLQIATQ